MDPIKGLSNNYVRAITASAKTRYPKSVEGALLKSIPKLMNPKFNSELTITIPDNITLPRCKTEKIFSRTQVMTDKNKLKIVKPMRDSDKDQIDELDKFEFRPANFYKELQDSHRNYNFRLNSDAMHTEVDNAIRNRFNPSVLLPTVRSASQSAIQQKTTQMRLEKREESARLKERARYAHMYEDEMCEQYRTLSSQAGIIHEQATAIRNEVSEMNVEMRTAHEEMEYFRQLANKEEIRMKNTHRRLKLVEKTEALRNFDRFNEERKKKEAGYSFMVRQTKEQIQKHSQELVKLDAAELELKTKLKQNREARVQHYKQLLKEGTDTRSEGLQWIVRRLWELEVQVTAECFPQFLDDDAIHCILFLAQKIMETENLQKQLQSIPNRSTPKSQVLNPIVDMRNRLNKIKQQNIKISQPIYTLDKKTKKINVTWERVTEPEEQIRIGSNLAQYSQTNAIDEVIQQNKLLVQSTKEEEITRLNKECYMNNYEKKFGIQLNTVLGAIVGDNFVSRKVGVLQNQIKTITENREKVKTFTFSKNK